MWFSLWTKRQQREKKSNKKNNRSMGKERKINWRLLACVRTHKTEALRVQIQHRGQRSAASLQRSWRSAFILRFWSLPTLCNKRHEALNLYHIWNQLPRSYQTLRRWLQAPAAQLVAFFGQKPPTEERVFSWAHTNSASANRLSELNKRSSVGIVQGKSGKGS